MCALTWLSNDSITVPTYLSYLRGQHIDRSIETDAAGGCGLAPRMLTTWQTRHAHAAAARFALSEVDKKLKALVERQQIVEKSCVLAPHCWRHAKLMHHKLSDYALSLLFYATPCLLRWRYLLSRSSLAYLLYLCCSLRTDFGPDARNHRLHDRCFQQQVDVGVHRWRHKWEAGRQGDEEARGSRKAESQQRKRNQPQKRGRDGTSAQIGREGASAVELLPSVSTAPTFAYEQAHAFV